MNVFLANPLPASKEDFVAYTSTPPYAYLKSVTEVLRYFTLVIGGFILGYSLKTKGLLWGAVLGLATSLLMVYLLALGEYLATNRLALPDETLRFLSSAPIIVILTAVGGYLGQTFSRPKKK